MWKEFSKLDKFIVYGLGVFIGSVLIIAGICAYEAHGDTWTIDNGKFKSIYDNREDCIKENLGTGTTEMCDDETQVIYRD